MKMLRALFGMLLVAAALPVAAAPITTLSMSGTLDSAYDGASLFGPTPGSRSGAVSIQISYDAGSLSVCSNTDTCAWTLTAANNVVETVTINSITRSFPITGGTLTFRMQGGNAEQIAISFSGAGGLSFYGTFQDGNSLFGSPANVRNPQLNFTNVPLTSGSTGGSNLGGGTSFGFQARSMSASTAAVAAVTEPATAAMLAIGLLGAAFGRRAISRSR